MGKLVTHDSVCAVMVTYHPSQDMLENLHSVLAEADCLVVVDNGSKANELNALRNASREYGFHLIENGTNRGIAEALNQGVRWARTQEHPWVLLLDQDSEMRPGFVDAMRKTWAAHPRRDDLATIHPRYVHPDFGYSCLAPRAADGGLIWCMTSGAFMPAWIFDKIGWFASDFFIDWVDIEYCFRIRAAGYLMAESHDAILRHDPGHTAPASILGRRFWPSHHSAARRYYMFRNRVVVFRKYFFTLPLCTLKAMYASMRDVAKVFLGEDQRPEKFRSFLLGTWHGLTGKMGMRQRL